MTVATTEIGLIVDGTTTVTSANPWENLVC